MMEQQKKTDSKLEPVFFIAVNSLEWSCITEKRDQAYQSQKRASTNLSAEALFSYSLYSVGSIILLSTENRYLLNGIINMVTAVSLFLTRGLVDLQIIHKTDRELQ